MSYTQADHNAFAADLILMMASLGVFDSALQQQLSGAANSRLNRLVGYERACEESGRDPVLVHEQQAFIAWLGETFTGINEHSRERIDARN